MFETILKTLVGSEDRRQDRRRNRSYRPGISGLEGLEQRLALSGAGAVEGTTIQNPTLPYVGGSPNGR